MVRFATTWLAQPRAITRRARTVSGEGESKSPERMIARVVLSWEREVVGYQKLMAWEKEVRMESTSGGVR